MMKTPLALAALLLALPLAADAQTSVYRWVDKDGKVHFSDSPPPESAKDVQQRRVGGGGVEPELPYATQQAARRNPVVLYTAASCGDPCKQARELLRTRGIPYAERDPQLNVKDAEALTRLVGGLEVPVIVVGSANVKGFEAGEWNSALDTAGYPRSLPPGVRAPTPQPPVADPPAARQANPQAQEAAKQ
jgi:glutaredoxin